MKLLNNMAEYSSNPQIIIINAEPWHVGELRQNLQQEDANEILRFGVSIQYALWRSYRRAVLRKTAFIDGKIAAMFGASGELLGQTGQIWLITTNEVKKISALKFCRIYQQQLFDILKIFPILFNYVDASHTSAIRLLENVGAKFFNPESMGLHGGLYCKFEIKR